MFNDYARNMSGNIHDSKQEGEGLKILTPKQILQRLPISLAEIKACNNSQMADCLLFVSIKRNYQKSI